MLKKLKFIIYSRLFIYFTYYFIQFYSATLRLSIINEKNLQECLKAKKPVLLVAWHQQFFAAIRYFRSYSVFKPAIMISQSNDGELISSVANKCGWHTPRGSSSRGGRQALAAMIAHISKYGLGAHILDGPTGPIGKVKAGAIQIARKTGATVIPFYTRADNAWFFGSWDRFMLPKPFSQVTITYDTPIHFNNRQTFEDQRKQLETIMEKELVL